MEWISPTQHRDPMREWQEDWSPNYQPENAFDNDPLLETMAMALTLTPQQNFNRLGDYWSGWLELYPSHPIQNRNGGGVRVRLNYHKSNYYGRTHIQVQRDGEWRTVFNELPTIHTPYWHEIDTGFEIITGLRLRFERPEKLEPEMICFDFYDADFYGTLCEYMPAVNPPPDDWSNVPDPYPDPEPKPAPQITIPSAYWSDKQFNGAWRGLSGIVLESNRGVVDTAITWRNEGDEPVTGYISAYVEKGDGEVSDLVCKLGQTQTVESNVSVVAKFDLPLIMVSNSQYGKWIYSVIVQDTDMGGEVLADETFEFYVGTKETPEPPPVQDVAVWEITKGYTPHHLPDDFEGEVNLDILTPPIEMQAVWEHKTDGLLNELRFWAKDAPGNTLKYLQGGLYADYMVTATGDCTWEIPLGEDIDYFNYTKEELRAELESGQIASEWWGYIKPYRVDIAKVILKWFSVEEFGEPKKVAYGHPETGPLFEGDEDSYIEAHCGPEAGLRYALIGGKYQPEDTLWYYTKYKGSYEWRKARQEKPFGLPVFKVGVNWTSNGKPYGHWICALQVGEDTTLMDSWVFFQFGDNDIKIGDAQMRSPGDCSVREVIGFGDYASLKGSQEILGEWTY